MLFLLHESPPLWANICRNAKAVWALDEQIKLNLFLLPLPYLQFFLFSVPLPIPALLPHSFHLTSSRPFASPSSPAAGSVPSLFLSPLLLPQLNTATSSFLFTGLGLPLFLFHFQTNIYQSLGPASHQKSWPLSCICHGLPHNCLSCDSRPLKNKAGVLNPWPVHCAVSGSLPQFSSSLFASHMVWVPCQLMKGSVWHSGRTRYCP